ncbi:MAG: hypothetical protein H0W71_01510 [Sphingomonas sp.]|nr:hypothetical protein [Sphingomonas sp.]
MKFPLKLNREHWPSVSALGVPSTADPRAICRDSNGEAFTKAVSILKFGSTFKTTRKARFPLSIAAIAKREQGSAPVVLDVGASDGTTSIDVMRAFDFRTYYVTDLNVEVYVAVASGATWFFDCEGNCILRATDNWIVYCDQEGGIFPFNWVARRLMARAPPFAGNMAQIPLINHELRSCQGDVRVQKYDVMTEWCLEKADIVIAANVLNRAYFSDESISLALQNLRRAMKSGGRLAVIDNRPEERSTIFRLVAGVLVVEERINGGTDIEALAMSVLGDGG